MIKKKITFLLGEISKGIYEKDEVIKLSFLSSISGQSIFFIGPPGVAKSLIARRLKYVYKDCISFEYLMNRFSTPDEIFGPISIEELKGGKYIRLTEGYLPQADVVFLDEIWKAGPSIQNTLLTVLNERVFKNGINPDPVKMKVLISASNELPTPEQGLEALWDRFIIRYKIEGISDEDLFNQMIVEDDGGAKPEIAEDLKISSDEYISFQEKLRKVEVPAEIFKVIKFIRSAIMEYAEKNDDSVYVSDRRWKKIITILKASAFLNDRKKVDLMDCFLIRHCLWHSEDQINIVADIVSKAIKEFGYMPSLDYAIYNSQIDTYKKEVDNEIYEDVSEDHEDGNGNVTSQIKRKLISKKLSTHNVKGFDGVASTIYQKIASELSGLEGYLKKDLKDIRTNLFVPAELAAHVEENIQQLKEKLRQLKINTEKIQASYETLK